MLSKSVNQAGTGAIILFLLLSMFSLQVQAKDAELKLPLWLEVIYSADDVYDEKKKQVRDDVVGFLVADGMSVRKMRWYKPLFGNQNLLLFKAKADYIDKLVAETIKTTPLSVPPWSVSMGELTSNKINWKRLRYGPMGEEFKIDMYWCDIGRNKKQVVVYWGTEAKRYAATVTGLMLKLSADCKG